METLLDYLVLIVNIVLILSVIGFVFMAWRFNRWMSR